MEDSVFVVSSPERSTVQATLKRKKNILGFSATKRRNAVPDHLSSKMSMNTGLIKTRTENTVITVDDADDDKLEKIKNIFVRDLNDEVKKNGKVELSNPAEFMDFQNAMFKGPEIHVPLVAIIMFMYVIPSNPAPISRDIFLERVLNYKMWNRQLKIYQLQIKQVIQDWELAVETKIWDTFQTLLRTLYDNTETEFYNLRVKHLLDLWAATKDIAQSSVSCREAKLLLGSLMNYEKICLNDEAPMTINSESSRFTETTSTSCTPAHTQMVLVAAPGSKAVQRKEEVNSLDLDEEFTCLTSRFQTGKASLDISLQLDTQSKTLKAEVEMQDYVYDLKIYR